MTGKSRRQQIEEMLLDEPNDVFLQYGLAMEFVSEKADDEAVHRFRALLTSSPDYVPAFVQAGQALVRLGRNEEAKATFRQGIGVARQKGDNHAADEMEAFLDGVEG